MKTFRICIVAIAALLITFPICTHVFSPTMSRLQTGSTYRKPRLWNLWISIIPLPVMLPLDKAIAEELEGTQHETEEYHHRLELFLGNTHEDGEDGFSVGLTYEYRLQELFGIGGLWEYAVGDFDKWLFGVPVFIHPFKGLRFVLAPGLEHKHGDDEFLFRAGLAYEFETGQWSITPEFNVDFVDGEESFVYGLSIGWGF